MSFTFAQMDFSQMFPTSFALRNEWESISGLGIESLEVPGMERRRFLQTDRPRTRIAYNVILHAPTEDGIEVVRDQFMAHIDPARGPQRLIDEDYPEWYHLAAVSDEIVWERITWNCSERGYRYKGDVVFESYEDAAQRRTDEEDSIALVGETPIPLDGNTRAWPTFEIRSTLSSQAHVELTVERGSKDDFVVQIDGPLSAGQVMRLDYDMMQFAVWSGSTKVASLVDRMSTLDRLELHVLDNNTASVEFFDPDQTQDDAVLRTNRAPNPIGPDVDTVSGLRASSGVDLSVVEDGGRNVIKATANGASTSVYMDSSESYTPPVGTAVHGSVKVKVTENIDAEMRLTFSAYGGATRDVVRSDSVTQTVADGWVEHTFVSTIEEMPEGGYVRVLFWPNTGAAAFFTTGEGYLIKDYLIEYDTTGPFFDGDNANSGDKLYRWQGTRHDSYSEEYIIDPIPGTAVVYPNSRRQ